MHIPYCCDFVVTNNVCTGGLLNNPVILMACLFIKYKLRSYRLEGADLDPFLGGVRHFSRAFSRSATSVAPSSRARRYQDKAASKSPRAPRRTGRFRKTGSKVSANLTAPWASPASAARS